jgi:HAD superfamily hydrolase (TIGR01509 family)
MSVVDALLFDMDGTLVDTEHLWLRAETATMASMGADWTAEDQAHCLGGPMERVIAYMGQRAGGHDPDRVTAMLMTHMEELLRSEHVPWRPGARTLLEQAREAGIPRALVSASWRSLVDAVSDAVLHEVGPDAFDVTVAGDEVAIGKPDPAPYLAAAARLGARPNWCVVIEDSPTGVASGVAAGALVVAVPHLVPIPASSRVVVLDTLVDVGLADLREWLVRSHDGSRTGHAGPDGVRNAEGT